MISASEQIVRADNIRVSFSLAACIYSGMGFCLRKSFSAIMIRAGEELQAASLHSPAAVAAQLLCECQVAKASDR